MEKQPVDDLFARKLRDAEAPVGPDVFSQIQKRISAKPLPVHRPVSAWWYVASAACVLIAVWFVYMTMSTEQPINVPIAHNKQLPKKSGPIMPAENPVATATARRQQHSVGSNAGKTEKDKRAAKAAYPVRTVDASASGLSKKEPILIRSQQQPAERVAMVQKKEIQPVLNTPTIALNLPLDERVERLGARPKQTADRTIVLTIEEPQAVSRLATAQIDPPILDSQLHQKGLSGLLGKIRQLKNGEVLAKVTPPGNQNNQKNRFGRIFTEMKESLKNETTLE